MSAYSTLYISPQKAISYIHNHLGQINDIGLEEILDVLLDGKLYNVRIDPGGKDDNMLDSM
jgi:hypothetical protein